MARLPEEERREADRQGLEGDLQGSEEDRLPVEHRAVVAEGYHWDR